MSEDVLDISKIPKFQFEVNNQQLKNCIRQLHFQSKTHDKQIEKIKKDLQLRPLEITLAQTLTVINSGIQLDPVLVRQIAKRSQPKMQQNEMKKAGSKLGYKIGQVSDILSYLVQKMKQLQKRIDSSQSQVKTMIKENVASVQNQLDDYKKAQNKQNRAIKETSELNLASYEQKLREVQSKTLWQINDCKNKLQDRVTQQLVRDVVRQGQAKIMTKIQAALSKNQIDPAQVDGLQNRCIKMEKDMQLKLVQITARIAELRDNIQTSLPTRKEVNQEKLQNEKKIGNLQVQFSQCLRNIKHAQTIAQEARQDIGLAKEREDVHVRQISRIAKIVANLKLSDEFMKLMQKLDPHKMCQIDNWISTINQRYLKVQKQIQALKRYTQRMRQKNEICNMLAPNESNGKFDKDEINKLVAEGISAHTIVKKIPQIEGSLFQFRAYGDTINEINKRISKMHKEFDVSSLAYGLKAMQEYIKRQLLVMSTKITQIQSKLEEHIRRRPLSAKKTSDKISTSVSVKKLLPVDCISCFQNPIAERTPQRNLFGRSR